MATADEMLSETELELAKVAITIGELITIWERADGDPRPRVYVEDHIAPMGEGDILFSQLYTRLGDENPRSGFTLWVDDKAYRVTFEQHK